MSGHTPGPWRFGNASEDQRLVLGEDGGYVCNVQIYQTPRYMGQLDEPEREANALLIAAAPDLLEALQKLVDCCDDSDGAQYGTLGTSFVRSIATAAIAKATGGTL